MAASKLLLALVGSGAGLATSAGIGYKHGRTGDIPMIGGKVPVDGLAGALGYVAALGLAFAGDSTPAQVAFAAAKGVGDAGTFGLVNSSMAMYGNKKRKEAGELTGEPSPSGRTVTAGVPKPQTNVDPFANLRAARK